MSDAPSSRRAQAAERRRQRQRRLYLTIAIVSALVIVAAGGTAAALLLKRSGSDSVAAPTATAIQFAADKPAATAGAAPCTPVGVLTSFENAAMVQKLAEAYNAQPRDIQGRCVTVATTKSKSGAAAQDAAAGFTSLATEQRPAVWIPDSHSWLAVARDDGGTATVPQDGTSIASSDIILAMPQPLATSIGWGSQRPSWRDIYTAASDKDTWKKLNHPEWGSFKLGKTSPLVASSGEAALLASFGSAAGSVPDLKASQIAEHGVQSKVKQYELATTHYMATPEHILWHARQAEESGGAASDFLSAVIVDEKSVWDYNRGVTSRDGITHVQGAPPKEPLVPIYPRDGYYVADNPAVVLTGSWVDPVTKAAADDFLRYAGTAEGQQIVRDSGYRDRNGTLSDAVASVGNLPRVTTGSIPFPSGRVVAAAQKVFPDVRKRANVLFLVDVSGSMADPIATGQSKLAAAKDAIMKALAYFTPGDSVGLAAFSSNDASPLTPGMVTPVADIGTSRDKFDAALASLQPISWTPLYESVDGFAKQQAAAADPDRINAIVLLTDGKEEGLHPPTVSKEQMLADLKAQRHHDSRDVLVFTLAYGTDADVDVLKAIAAASGAHYYDATDPTKVGGVLGDLVTSF